jgi:hypothetical protein
MTRALQLVPTDPTPSPREPARGECSRCSAPIVFSNHRRLYELTGWVWRATPGSHLQPVCARCIFTDDAR